jgi:hypothetical protein
MRRLASTAAAKKWPRLFHGWAGRFPSNRKVRFVDQGCGLERLPGLLLRQPLRSELP